MKWWVLLLVPTAVFVFSENSKAQMVFRVPASEAKKATIQDQVEKMRDDDDGIVVLFAKAKGNHYLRRDVANFENLRLALQKSLKEKKPVSVIVDSNTLNIVDVK
jgi:biopolymer transport protein ExbD